jgi:O-acetyl-ADP-ribose deacetylase (regulator of RNase III)
MFNRIVGDILDSKEKYICHQCNSVTIGSAGLARYIFDKYPYADIYSKRRNYETIPIVEELPGNIIICGNGDDQRYIINLIAQFYPSYPRDDLFYDSTKMRENYFKECLDKIKEIDQLDSIAFPYKIGCGLAGGNWENYEKMIETFAEELNGIAEVWIYSREGD